ncbi:MAG: DUF3078 domain-containing protein [Draconibacterium sp.]|nr:DUF3078 domain-containing protein [Draconibacterium sp.]
MFSGKEKYIILFIIGFFIVPFGFSQVSEPEKIDSILEKGLQIIKKYFYEENNWHIAQPGLGKDVKGLLHFIEDDPVDSILKNINNSFEQSEYYVVRLPENVPDSLEVPGYYPNNFIEMDIENIGVRLQKVYRDKKIVVPDELMSNLDERLELIPEGKGMQLFIDSIYTIPDSLQIPEIIPDSLFNSTVNFENLRRTDSLRTRYIEQKRQFYNDSVVSLYLNSVINDIRTKQFDADFNFRIKKLNDSVKINNYNILKTYNDQVVGAVNDSIYLVLQTLSEYADFIDTVQVSISNLTGGSTDIILQNGRERFARVWLKNEQNDSLSVMVKNTDKRNIQMLIDDGVTFSRYKQKKTKDFDFNSLKKEIVDFTNVGKSYAVETPWRIGGDGNVGFTQTYLENWKKGGQSALALLIVLKGFANYARADGKIKWENSAEIRNGWIKPGGKGSELQKNDDRLEFTTRFGVSAFKKWYYSSEFNYETQFFKGFRYPTKTNPDPISAFMSPGKSFFKLGLEYKPNAGFSMLLSPLTLKNVYVRDTTLIDQTKFGVAANLKSFWEPGLNADIKFKKNITADISYETKYKMFINYKAPFSKFDINWENLFAMRLTDYMNMRLMVHFIYDDDILFPIENALGEKIGEKPKLQVKELITIGFAYKINRKVMRTKRIR